MGQNVVGRWQVADAIKSLVNTRDLQIECDRVLHEILLWKEKERSRVEKDNLRALLGIRRMDRVLDEWIKKL